MTRARAKVSADGDLAYHRREWAIQRIGWLAMALFLLAAVAGLFGSGPLSRTQSGDPARGTIDYERFAHYGTETSLRICGPPSPGAPAELRVGIPRAYAESFAIRSVVPEARIRGLPPIGSSSRSTSRRRARASSFVSSRRGSGAQAARSRLAWRPCR
jgi:hypothetical protein